MKSVELTLGSYDLRSEGGACRRRTRPPAGAELARDPDVGHDPAPRRLADRARPDAAGSDPRARTTHFLPHPRRPRPRPRGVAAARGRGRAADVRLTANRRDRMHRA